MAMVEQAGDDLSDLPADRVVVLAQGTVAWKGAAGELKADAALKRRLLGGAQ